jgi:hypothetical protein
VAIIRVGPFRPSIGGRSSTCEPFVDAPLPTRQ